MKRIVALCICLVLVALCFTGCQEKPEYTPSGEFYVKTSPSRGDGGVSEVISLEAEHKSYESDGDITVSMTVGLGHLSGQGGYGDDVQDTLYVLYKIIASPPMMTPKRNLILFRIMKRSDFGTAQSRIFLIFCVFVL